ncbi:hypothetical protein M9H77_20520 [Catharanthus roseus]|uniref:Uncharacterized protein n=1 Tax=Catharanthus roseus TaxID=4058 RepID=A0ACC0AJS3_CATRO|nr:hypothetical protein M9H77_20520 [Catharanthus roseus]
MELSIIFCKASLQDSRAIRTILHDYASISSQEISLNAAWPEDRLIWNFTPNGIYTIKSCYKVDMIFMSSAERSEGPSTIDQETKAWNAIHSLLVQQKIRIFCWRAAQNVLPIGRNLLRKVISMNILDFITILPPSEELDVSPPRRHWHPPSSGSLKINIDVAFSEDMIDIGIVAIIIWTSLCLLKLYNKKALIMWSRELLRDMWPRSKSNGVNREQWAYIYQIECFGGFRSWIIPLTGNGLMGYQLNSDPETDSEAKEKPHEAQNGRRSRKPPNGRRKKITDVYDQEETLRFPGLSATLRVLSISFRAFLLRISTLTEALLSIFIYGFFDFFSARTLDFIDCTKCSS